jgi:hypothetical protein
MFSIGYGRGASGTISVRSKWIALLPPGHREFLSIQKQDGAALDGRLLSANAASASLNLRGEMILASPGVEIPLPDFWRWA